MFTSTIITMKRKADSMTDVCNLEPSATKKLKMPKLNDVATHVSYDAGDRADGYQPDGSDEEESLCAQANSSPDLRSGSQRFLDSTLPDINQQLRDAQVSFIIITRDNNLPDTYCQRSTTCGPLPWPAVAKLYNKQFGMTVGGAAMEKRARLHREAWMSKRPGYPRCIVYAEKVKIAKHRAARKPKHRQVAQVAKQVQHSNPSANDEAEVNTAPIIPEPNAHPRVAGWLPPDSTRDAADIANYCTDRTPVPTDQQADWLVIEVEDPDEQPLGDIHIPVEHIRRSSKWTAEELRYNVNMRLKLTCRNKVAVERYVSLITPSQLSALPDWDMVSLIGVYCVAAQMQDDRVRFLILQRWEEMSEQDGECAVELEDLDDVFHSTENGDPARVYWARAVFFGGLAGQVVAAAQCHGRLREMLEFMMEHRWQAVD